ncbi:hypothetical protein GYMLUDRAFT_70870 [Collybiopsis luxurians FD-317 M1]|nr:hypothetical protein GYMLUDRAFT_70870 [Collybiopsis luxurians FD-317 M1]
MAMPPTKVTPELVYDRAHARPVISTAASDHLRKVLKENDSPTKIAINSVNTQLKLWKDVSEKDAASSVDCQVLGLDLVQLEFNGYLGEYAEEDTLVISKAVQSAATTAELKKGIWSWFKLPYTIRRVGSGLRVPDNSESSGQGPDRKKKKVVGSDELVDDVDEWVLRNEVFLRSLSKTHSACPSILKPWSVGLVRIKDLQKTFHSCSLVTSPDPHFTHAIKLSRFPLDTIPGFTILADKRRPTLFVQPSASEFKSRFDCMTGGLLAGLDWNNVFVAGGLILGALLTPDIPPNASLLPSERTSLHQPSEWLSSDIDLYIYGLDAEAANEKIKHIADVYRGNLGSADAPFLIVRNSQTITLYSEWPKRRVQVVLKLVKSPREVLLNFDLDICAIGWDGKEVWMLPRVFKYAKRGYGIRIIPLYIGFLSPFQNKASPIPAEIRLGEDLSAPPLSLDTIAKRSHAWTRKVVKIYIKNGHEGLTFHWPEDRWPKVEVEGKGKGKGGKPVFSHAMLEGYGQIVSEPLGRSCLTGFELLMRHVALWELEIEGKIQIYEHIFAEDAYNHIGEVAYDDTPAYEWDENFKIAEFVQSLDKFNEKETEAMEKGWNQVNSSFVYDKNSNSMKPKPRLFEFPKIKRVTHASSVEEIFSSDCDLAIPIVTTEGFVGFANGLIREGLKEGGHGLLPQGGGNDEEKGKGPLVMVTKGEETDYGLKSDEVLSLWRLNRILNWQMMDRRIDEVRELLWAFHRSNERLFPEYENRVDILRTNISKRAIRTSETDESRAFVRWVARKPHLKDAKVNMIFNYADPDLSWEPEDWDVDDDGEGEGDEDEE